MERWIEEQHRAAADRIDTDEELRLEPSGSACEHVRAVGAVRPRTGGCEECLRDGTGWVHLRVCMTCGHVGCCDSSPNRHATKHHHATSHPVVRSLEPGESWGWCYPDQAFVE